MARVVADESQAPECGERDGCASLPVRDMPNWPSKDVFLRIVGAFSARELVMAWVAWSAPAKNVSAPANLRSARTASVGWETVLQNNTCAKLGLAVLQDDRVQCVLEERAKSYNSFHATECVWLPLAACLPQLSMMMRGRPRRGPCAGQAMKPGYS